MSIKIFLADDNQRFRQALHALLAMESDLVVVGEATNGCDAVTQILQLCPDIAILDLFMPVMDGIEATRQLAQKAPAIRVIILTFHAASQPIQRALAAGAWGYLLKEYASSEVVAAIHTVYEGFSFIGNM